MATRFVSALKNSLDRVLTFPDSGAPRDQLAVGLRATFYEAYVIYYRAAKTELAVIRILHGARDHAAVADHGGFGS